MSNVPSQSSGADDAPQLLLTIEQAARRLGVGRSTLYGLLLDREIESITIGRLRRIPPDALAVYIARQRERVTLSFVDEEA